MKPKHDLHQAIANYRQTHPQESFPTKLRAVLFDMDGVLFNSMPAHSKSWVQASNEVGLTMTPEDAYWFEGQTGGYTIDLLYDRCLGRSATAEEKAVLYQRKTDLFNQYNSGATLPHVELVLQQLWDVDRVIVTGSSQASLLGRLEEAFPGSFSADKMVTGKDVTIGKPHPEPYLMGLERVGILPTEAFVIENAPMGVEAAVAAGIFTIAVNTGPLPDEALSSRGANLVYSSMIELAEELPSLRELWSKPF